MSTKRFCFNTVFVCPRRVTRTSGPKYLNYCKVITTCTERSTVTCARQIDGRLNIAQQRNRWVYYMYAFAIR